MRSNLLILFFLLCSSITLPGCFFVFVMPDPESVSDAFSKSYHDSKLASEIREESERSKNVLALVNQTIQHYEVEQPEELEPLLAEYKIMLEEIAKKIEKEYQGVLDRIVTEAIRVQEEIKKENIKEVEDRNSINDSLRKLANHEIQAITLNITQKNSVNAVANPDALNPTIEIPFTFIIRTVYELQEPTEKEQLFSFQLSDTALIELEEIMRFTLAHEASHIWLGHNKDSVNRELEADAMGVLLSTKLSYAFKFQKAVKWYRDNGKTITFYEFDEIKLFNVKTGVDVLFNYYEDYELESNTNLSADSNSLETVYQRKNLEERKTAVKTVIEEIEKKYTGLVSIYSPERDDIFDPYDVSF